MMGRLPYRRPLVKATCTKGFASLPERQQYVRGRFEHRRATAPTSRPVGGHGSHLMGDLAEANALIVVPAEATEVGTDSQVQVLVLDRDF